MQDTAADLSRRLAREAEAVCRHYLGNGRRSGRYWLVGDTDNSPGRSLFVRLTGPEHGPGAAGKWRDAATGEHGDLLDLIAVSRNLNRLTDVLAEAREFLRLPKEPAPSIIAPAPAGTPLAARRLWQAGRPISGTVVEAYLRNRGLAHLRHSGSLRFHPDCYWQSDDGFRREALPAMLAKVTDTGGTLTGLHRTWLTPAGGKWPEQPSRRAMGQLLGNAVRFGPTGQVCIIGEGIETTLSLQAAMPIAPAAAALSAAHLAELEFWPTLRRLYVAVDNDPAGRHAASKLLARTTEAGIDLLTLTPRLGDWNDDLRNFGPADVRAAIRPQLDPADVALIR